jgi:hypothetical protein
MRITTPVDRSLSIGFPDHLSKGILLYLARWVFAYRMLPIVLAIALWRYTRIARGGATECIRSVVLLVLVGGALFAEVAVSPIWLCFFCIFSPAAILLASAVVELPGGKIATTSGATEKWRWLAAHTRPGEYVLQAEWPSVYLPLPLRNPIYLDVVASEAQAISDI